LKSFTKPTGYLAAIVVGFGLSVSGCTVSKDGKFNYSKRQSASEEAVSVAGGRLHGEAAAAARRREERAARIRKKNQEDRRARARFRATLSGGNCFGVDQNIAAKLSEALPKRDIRNSEGESGSC